MDLHFWIHICGHCDVHMYVHMWTYKCTCVNWRLNVCQWSSTSDKYCVINDLHTILYCTVYYILYCTILYGCILAVYAMHMCVLMCVLKGAMRVCWKEHLDARLLLPTVTDYLALLYTSCAGGVSQWGHRCCLGELHRQQGTLGALPHSECCSVLVLYMQWIKPR